MAYLDPIVVGSVIALIAGIGMLAGGLWGRSQFRRNTRGGGVVLASFAALIGFITAAASLAMLAQSI